MHVTDCIPAEIYRRLRRPPPATRQGDCYRLRAPRPGLGDIVAAGLAAVGITPERVSAVTGRSCGCQRRKAALNRIGRRFGIG